MLLPDEPKSKTLTELILAVFRCNGKLLDRGEALVAPLNLTSARWQVLGALGLNEALLTAPQIAQAMGITRQGVQKQLHGLIEDGYVRRQDNPRHARSVLYTLTASGRTVLGAAMAAQAVWAGRLGATLPLEELRTALGVLERLRQALDDTPLPTAEAR